MVAVMVSAGALLLVLLAHQSSSYPAKKGKGAYSSAGYDSVPPLEAMIPAGYGSGAGSGYGSVPPLEAMIPAGYGSGASSGYGSGASSGYGSVPPLEAMIPAGYGSGYGSGIGGGPVTTYSSGSFVGPAASGHTGSSFGGPAASVYFPPAARQGVAWSVEPPSFLSNEVTSTSLSSSSNVSPPGYRPQYQGGELSQAQNIYEFGNSESETEDQGAPSSPGATLDGGPGFASQSAGYGSGQAIYPYPYPYDYMFLTGQYAPGTVTHASSSFEQGRDNREDIHYVWEYYPSTQEVQTFDAVKQPSQTVKQPVKWPQGSTSGGQASHTQPGRTTYHRVLPRLG